MDRRKRKQFRKGEFTELGVFLNAKTTVFVSDEIQDLFIDKVIDFAESQSLSIWAVWNRDNFWMNVSSAKRRGNYRRLYESLTEVQWNTFFKFLTSLPEVRGVKTTGLVDIHGDKKYPEIEF